MKTHKIAKGDEYIGKSIKEATFREQGYIVIGLRYRDGRMIFAPKAQVIMEENMDVYLFGPAKPRESE